MWLLSTPSSSPPVQTQFDFQSHADFGHTPVYLEQISMFSCRDSSRQVDHAEKRTAGLPVAAKCFSPASSSRPSIHGSSFFRAVVSVQDKSGTIHNVQPSAERGCANTRDRARIAAPLCGTSDFTPLPAIKEAPPLENRTITGALTLAAV